MTTLITILKNTWAYKPLRSSYWFSLKISVAMLKPVFILFPQLGIKRYQLMQKKAYLNYTKTYEDSKNLCVGMFDFHEKYPYEEYLLEFYGDRVRTQALDFACGIGRMINRMLVLFETVDGADINENNLVFARRYLSENGKSPQLYKFYLVDGVTAKVPAGYAFIYSTIALQHIAVYSVRKQIFIDLFNAVSTNGMCCFQVGFGWDSGTHWFDNNYAAMSTNGGCDVSIPDDSHLPAIENDFKSIGFKKVMFVKKPSPHPHIPDYHKNWLFIHLWK